MFTKTRTGSTTDMANFFSDDFYNSAVIYQFPRTEEITVTLSYLMREDLIAQRVYGDCDLLGFVLLSLGETCHMEGDSVVKDFSPLQTVHLRDSSELSDSLSMTVKANTLTDKSRSPDTWQAQEELRYEYSSGRFKPPDS